MRGFVTSVLTGLAALGAVAQADNARPRLVVGIVVDQLRTDYIEQLQSYFGEHGFNALLRDGVYMRDVDFRTSPLDAVSATAMIYTGAYPSQNGVPSAMVPDGAALTSAMRLPLTTVGKSLNNDSFTPEALRLTTIADELAIDGGGFAQIYSVAMDPQQAVAMAGHAGNGAFWINNTSGNWVSTSYYGAVPSVISSRNFRNSLSHRIDTMQWRADARIKDMPGIAPWKKTSPFRYTFSRQDRDLYKKFANTPLSNREITDVAIDIIGNLNLGANQQATDMLNVAYTVAPYKYGAGDSRAELADAYLRLDAQLGRLLDAIEKKAGKGNALIWLSSTGYCDEAVVEDKKYRLPGGEFSTKRATSLLNSYLSARNGNASYVSGIRDGFVYLDHKTIEVMRLDADAIARDARSLLSKMSGVADAYLIEEILTPGGDDTRQRIRNATDPSLSGDIVLRFTPGWTVVYDEQLPVQSKQSRECSVLTPAFIAGPGIVPARIDTTVEGVQLAPTVTSALRIRAPNGASARPINLRANN